MRFLIDAHHLGRRQTGNETWTRNVVRALESGPTSERRGADLVYAVTRAGVPHLPESVADDRRVLVSPSSVRRLAWDLPRAIRQARADVAMVQYTVAACRAPMVLMIHDLSFEDDLSKEILPLRSRIRYRATVRLSARAATHILVPSEFTKSTILARYPVKPAKVSVASPAVDPDLHMWLARIPRKADADVLTVLCVGNLLPRKNVETVARAVRLLRNRLDVRLHVVGPIPREGVPIQSAICELLGPAVTFAGHVPLEALARAYRQADVFCFPTKYEGFGIPILEAMAAGLPVVCSNTTALPEVAGEAATYVEPMDVSAWARAIEDTRTADAESIHRFEAAQDRLRTYRWEATAAAVFEALHTAALRIMT